MNCVQAVLLEDPNKKRYTYSLREDMRIEKGSLVRVHNADGREKVALCVTDSENLSENAVDMVMQGKKVLSYIAGRYCYFDINIINELAKSCEQHNEEA